MNWKMLLVVFAVSRLFLGCGDGSVVSAEDAAVDGPTVAIAPWRLFNHDPPGVVTRVAVNGERRVSFWLDLDVPVASDTFRLAGVIWFREGASPTEMRAPPPEGAGGPAWVNGCDLEMLRSSDEDGGISFGRSHARLAQEGIESLDWSVELRNGRNIFLISCQVRPPHGIRYLTMGVQRLSATPTGSNETVMIDIEPALRWQGGAAIPQPPTRTSIFEVTP